MLNHKSIVLYTSNKLPRNATIMFLKEDSFWFVCKFYQELFPVLESHAVDDRAAYRLQSPTHTPPLVCIWNRYSYAESVNIRLYFEFKIQYQCREKHLQCLVNIFFSLLHLNLFISRFKHLIASFYFTFWVQLCQKHLYIEIHFNSM